jgi:CheY-like chemotaxis protein
MSKRILVADDSRTIQRAFAMVMSGSGYELSFARSVDEALALAKKDGRPDLVLSDTVLGTGSGYDLCAGIKGDSSLADVPVYILASSHNPYDEVRGRKVGADGHLAKPFESQSLLDAVASALAPPARSDGGSMPEFSADFNDNTARIASRDFAFGDDDSYGEITIERGSAPASSPAQAAAAWAKPATRPSGSRPAVSVPPAATPPPSISPRPSLIPGARPSSSMPAVRTGMTPQPSTSAPVPAAARPALNRTMMGFPSVKPPVPVKPAASVPVAVPAPMARPTPAVPSIAVPARPPTGIPATAVPATPSGPIFTRPVVPPPPTPPPSSAITSSVPATALAPPAVRPPLPRVPPMQPPISSVLSPAPVTRKVTTPVPPAAVAPPSTPTSSPSFASAVSSIVEQKVAAIAARGPEYEAIVKLSREIIEQVVWEVVPELAETIIRQEIDRLASAKK